MCGEMECTSLVASTITSRSGAPLAGVVNDPAAVCESTSDFIWHIFTRFEPAADMVGDQFVKRMHVGFEGPLIVDCRMKPWYPEELVDDEDVLEAVQSKWGSLIEAKSKRIN